MSKIIGFVTDKAVPSTVIHHNKAKKIAFTEMAKHSCLAYQLGDWSWTWSQIEQGEKLEPETKYVYRFAVYGGYNDTEDSTFCLNICVDEDWDNRKSFELSQYSITPHLSKKCGDNIIRVYEIPFKTGKSGETMFVFSAMHAVSYVMPAFTDDAYSELNNTSYDEWFEGRKEFLALDAKNKAKKKKRKLIHTIIAVAAISAVVAVLLHKNDKCDKSECCCLKKYKGSAEKLKGEAVAKLSTAKAFVDDTKDALIIKIENLRSLGK